MPEIRSKWSKKVSNLILSIISPQKPFEQKIDSLESLQPYLIIQKLIYTTPEEELNGKDLLLQLWNYLVDNIFIINSDYRRNYYSAIWGIMNHEEFHMSENGIVNQDTVVAKDAVGLQILMRYKATLIKTWNVCSGMFVKAAIALHDETFCAEMGATCYLRLTEIRKRFDEFFSELTPPCADELTPACRIKESVYRRASEMKDDEHNVFYITHKIDRAHFPRLTNVCTYVETMYKGVYILPKYEERKMEYLKANPNLFNWDNIPCEISVDFRYFEEYKSFILRKPHFIFSIVRLMVNHCVFHLPRPIQWEFLPSYFLVLRTILPYIQESFVGNYSVSNFYSAIIPSNTYLSANRTALALLQNSTLIDLIIKLAIEPCAIHSLPDVEIAIQYLESYFEELKDKKFQTQFQQYLEIVNKYGDDLEKDQTPRFPVDSCSLQMEFYAYLFCDPTFCFPFYKMEIKNEIYPRCFDIDTATDWFMSLALVDSSDDAKIAIERICDSKYCCTINTLSDPPTTVHYLRELNRTKHLKFRFLDSGMWSLPKTFNFHYFYKVLDRLLSQDHYQILIRVITFLYHTMDLFHSTHRVMILVDLIIEKYFWTLFTHWYCVVRSSFMTFLTYKLFRTKRTLLPCLTPQQILDMADLTEDDLTGVDDTQLLAQTSSKSRKESSSYKMAKNPSSRISRLASHFSTIYTSYSNPNDHSTIFYTSMDHEAEAIDLEIASKLDSLIQSVCDQITSPDENIIPEDKKVYAVFALREYLEKLKQYYIDAKKAKDDPVPCPDLTYVSTKMRNDI